MKMVSRLVAVVPSTRIYLGEHKGSYSNVSVVTEAFYQTGALSPFRVFVKVYAKDVCIERFVRPFNTLATARKHAKVLASDLSKRSK